MTQRLGPAGRIGRFFIDSKLTPLLVAAALGLGAFAVALTPREEEPQIVVPIVDLFVGLPGASPTKVENRATRWTGPNASTTDSQYEYSLKL